MSTRITSPHAMKNINAVKFNADGSRILVSRSRFHQFTQSLAGFSLTSVDFQSTTSKRLSVIDAERGELICSYDNCAYSGRDRSPLASDPRNPFLATCGCTNGKGLVTFDLRKQQPAHFALNVHSSLIRDIIYLDQSWPFGSRDQSSIVSLSLDGVCKIRTIDHVELHSFEVKHRSSCLTATTNIYSAYEDSNSESILMIGGDNLTCYMPANLHQEPRLFTYGKNEKPIQKLKYTSNGHLLYAISSRGQVKRYRRMGTKHQFLGQVYSHNDEIIDMDISPNDEYIVTASRDGQVGLLCLGAPSYGWTGYMELA